MGEGVYVGELLEQQRLALHHGHGGFGAQQLHAGDRPGRLDHLPAVRLPTVSTWICRMIK
jgi:hypothetical protein